MPTSRNKRAGGHKTEFEKATIEYRKQCVKRERLNKTQVEQRARPTDSPIYSLQALQAAVIKKQSVICPSMKSCGALPAAWVYQQSGERILHLIKCGLFVYTPKRKVKR